MKTATSSRSYAILSFAVVLAACSIVYELLLAQTLAVLAANAVRWYSLSIGFFLISMGFGAFLYSRVPKSVDRLHLLFWIEVLLTILGVVVVAGVHTAHMLHGFFYLRGYDPTSLFVFLVIPLVLCVTIGALSGFELPILMDYAREGGSDDDSNEVLAADYFGSLVGSVAFPFILLSYFQLFEIGLVTASINIAVAVFLLMRYLWSGRVGWVLRIAVLCAVGAGMFQAFLHRDWIHNYYLSKYYYYLRSAASFEALFEPFPDIPEIFSVQSPYQRIDIVHDDVGSPDDGLMRLFSSKSDEKPGLLINRILFLNGDFQTNTLHEEVYHEWFAHVPIILRGEIPKRILLLGGGDGYLLRELVKYDDVESILHIDLDRTLVDAAQNHPALLQANERAFSHPKVKTSFQDGYQFVRTTEQRFDAIYIDFPLPTDYNLAKLYSVEFYSFVKKVLKESGFAVFDASGIGLVTPPNMLRQQFITEENDWPVYYNTVKAAGFPVIIPYLTTLGFFDDSLVKRALPRTDLVQTPVDSMLGVSSDVKLFLRERALGEIIGAFILNFQQGFILLAKDEDSFDQEFWQPPVSFRVLNRLRFEESFMTQFPESEEIDRRYVNSIMLPQFPTVGFWTPRLPW